MKWDIIQLKFIQNRSFWLQFKDGLSGTIEMDTSFCFGVFEPLKEEANLAQATLENGVIIWANGLDLAPDTLYQEIQKSPLKHYKIERP